MQAYILATAQWETAHKMWPIREYGRGQGRPYGKTDPVTGQSYYGRGFVQLTWKRNYKTMGDLLGVDLVGQPDQALELHLAADILVIGMRDGLFAPKSGKLSKYLGKSLDWIGARRTVNGTDKAIEIAAIARLFHAILQKSYSAERMIVIERPPSSRPVREKVTIASLLIKLFRYLLSKRK